MRCGSCWGIAAVALAIAANAGRASAQMPVCAGPDPAAPVFSTCITGGRFAVVPFLASLAVDQLLKGDGAAITRSPRELLSATAGKPFVEANESLAEYIARLDEIRLSRLDTSTGTLQLDVGEADRKYTGAVTIAGSTHEVSIELPPRLEAGYWRTPGVLQMAFWKGQRPSFRTGSLSAEVECVVVAADGIRMITAGETPDVLVRFEGCE